MSVGPLKCVLVESSLLNVSDDGLRQWTRSARGSVGSSGLAAAKAQPIVPLPSVHSTPRQQQQQQICQLTPLSASATARKALEPLFVNEGFSGSAEGSGAGVRLSPPYADANTDATLSTAGGYVRTWPRQRAHVASSTAAPGAAGTANATPSIVAFVPRGGGAEGITADALNAQRRLLGSHSSRKRSRPALLANSPLVGYAEATSDLQGYYYTPTGSAVCSTLVCCS